MLHKVISSRRLAFLLGRQNFDGIVVANDIVVFEKTLGLSDVYVGVYGV